MRTTVDLPDELMRAAKAEAALRGESLKDLFARAVALELRSDAMQPGRKKVSLPLIRGSGPRVTVTNADIETALAAEDAERYGSR
jgi:hypothetical protein